MAVSGAWTYTLSGSNATITDYNVGTGGTNATIPTTLDGYNVTAIYYRALFDKGLTSITINHALHLGTECFRRNGSISTKLTVNLNATITSQDSDPFLECVIGNNLTIGSGVTSIPYNLFKSTSLTSVTFPSSLTTVNTGAFRNNSIASVTIPSTLTSIGELAFGYNSGIAVTLNSNTTYAGVSPFEGCNIGNGLTIGSNVTTIAGYLFKSAGLTSVTFPNGLTTINSNTFQNNSLTSVSLPTSVTTVGSSAFENNSGLANFYVYNNSVSFSSSILSGNMSASPKGTIYGGDPSNTKTWWTNNYTGTYNFSSSLGTTPTVTSTSPATNLTTSTADVAGNVSSDGGATITERGFVYGTSANPTTANSKKTVSGTTGAMSATITGLSETTTYHFRAYATNAAGTSYGADVQFTTASSVSVPTVTTTSPVTNITSTTVDVAGNVSSDGNATITERGFCYGTSATPSIANSKVFVSGTTGSMSASITGLSTGTTYHVRAYATNSQGTAYGADVSFSTLTPTLVYYDGTYPVNPQYLPTGITQMRLSWWSKLGQCMVKVKDHTNSNYFTLTDSEGNTGTSITFDSHANWLPSPDTVSFSISESGHANCVDIRPEFYNLSGTEKLYINAPQLTYDRTKKWAQLYKAGNLSSNVENLITYTSEWNSVNKFKLGTYYFWIDGTGALRKKNGVPTGDTDGDLV